MLRRSMLLLVLLGSFGGLATAQTAVPTGVAKDEEPALYSLGLSLWRVLAPLGLSPAELEILARGLEDAAKGKAELSPEDVAPQVSALRKARAPRALAKEKARSASYVENAAKEPGAVTTPSGLVYFDVKTGTGDSPTPSATVKLNYRGTLIDGSEFDSSRPPGTPAQLRLGEVIPCLREGVQKMKVGGKGRLLCPPSIAYGDRGRPSIPGGSALTFEVELVEIAQAVPTPSR